MATYVISDLHGQYRLFLKLLEKVKFSGADKLYMLGDAIDRGPDGIKILRHVMNAHNMHFLLGNHETMMLHVAASDGSVTPNLNKFQGRREINWLFQNGGAITYHRYRLLRKKERKELLKWLNSCPVSTKVEVNGTTFFLTHTAFVKEIIDTPYKDIDPDVARYIVWYSPFREDIYKSIDDYAACKPWVFVIGHVPAFYLGDDKCARPLSSYREENVIDIDGGCAEPDEKELKGGIMLRLDDLEEFTVSFAELENDLQHIDREVHD